MNKGKNGGFVSNTSRTSRITGLFWSLFLGIGLITGLLVAVSPSLAVEARAESSLGNNLEGRLQSAAGRSIAPGFTVDLSRDAVWGMVNPGDVVTITRTAGGEAYGAAEADGVGFFWSSFWQSNGEPADIVGGDVLEVFVNGVLAATLSPSDITGEVDVLTDRVTGNVVGLGTETTVTVTIQGIDNTVTEDPQVTDELDGSGDFIADFAGVADLNPGMMGLVQYKDGSGNTVQAFVYPSEVFRVRDWLFVEGFAPVSSQVTVTVYMTYPNEVRWQDTTIAGYPFGVYQVKGDIEYGDVVEVDLGAGNVMSVEAGYLDIRPDGATDQILGKAPAGSTVRGFVWDLFDGYYEDSNVADGGGNYTLDLGLDLLTRYSLYVGYTDADGDEVGYNTALAHIAAYPADMGNYFAAVADRPNQPVTYTLNTGEEILTDHQMCGETNWCDGSNFNTTLEPGDVVTAELPNMTMAMTVADFTINIDTARDEVNGSADIAGQLIAYAVQWYNDQYPVHGWAGGTAEAASPYVIKYPGFDIRDGMNFIWTVHFAADGGHQTVNALWSEQIPYIEVNAPNGVGGVTPNADEPVTATLYTAGGVEIATNNYDDDGDPQRFWLDFGEYGIEPGDWITVTSESGWTAGVQVPELTVSADMDTEMIWGKGPKALVMVEHGMNNDQNWGNRFVPVDDYVLDSSFFGDDIQWGDSINVIYQASNGSRVREEYIWPRTTVNYGADWVQVNYAAGHTIKITATNGIDNYTLVKDSESGQGWWTDSGLWTKDEWVPEQPDIQPGYLVEVESDEGYSSIVQIGIITGTLDPEDNSVSGYVYAPWFDGDLQILCHPDTQWPMVYQYSTAAADGSSPYYCQWDPEMFNIQNGENVFVTYVEPDDNDWVSNSFHEPVLNLKVNYAHEWVGVKTEPFTPVEITVAGKGTLEATTDSWGEMYSQNWENDWSLGRPELEPGDIVTATAIGKTAAINPVPIINGQVDIDEDTVSGSIEAPWFAPQTLTVRCEVWIENGPDGVEVQGVAADGGEYTCDFDDVGWDLEYQHTVAVMLFEPDGDQVINIFDQPKPDMRVEKWREGGDVLAGGSIIYTIHYRNDGNADAETVILTDTLPANTTYTTDTSGFTANVSGGQVVWSFGPVESGEDGRFLLVLNNTANPGDTLVNQVDISTLYDVNDGNDHAEADVNITDEGEAHVYVNKNPVTGDPVAGQDMLWEIYYGNDGPVSSGPVVLTDTLPEGTTIDYWRSENNYSLWTDDSTASQLILKADALPGNWGDTIYLWLKIDPAVEPKTQLTNTVEIATAGSYAQETRNDVWVGEPNYNMYVNKQFGWGQLVPGGEIGYNIHVRNLGNMLTSSWLTDVLPEGTSFQESWIWTGSKDVSFPPTGWDDGNPVWDLGEMKPGEWYNLNIRLGIDGSLAPGTNLYNCATVATDEESEYLYDNESCTTDAVRPNGPNLRVNKNYWWDGDSQLVYEIKYENIGTSRLGIFTITDTYPSGTTFNGNWYVQYGPNVTLVSDDPVNRQLVFQTDQDFEKGNNGSIQLRLDVDDAGVQGLAFANMVEAPVTDDVYPLDNSDVVTATSGPDIYVEKWVSGGLLEPGKLVTFTIEFGNRNMWPWSTGPDSHITDTLPAGMTFITATAPWNSDEPWTPNILPGNVLEWGWGEVRPDNFWQFDLVAQISDTVKTGDVLVNVVEMYSDSPEDIEYDYTNNEYQLPMVIGGEKKIYLPLIMRQ